MTDDFVSEGPDADVSRYTERLGDYLKRHREASSLSLDSLAKTTRISKRFLQAFEENDLQRFPDDAFARGFLKIYARELGLEMEEVVARYEQLKKADAPTQIRVMRSPVERSGQGFESFAKSRWLWATLTVVLALGLLLFVVQVVLKSWTWEEKAVVTSPDQGLVQGPAEKEDEGPAATIIEPPLLQTSEPTSPATETSVPVKPSILTVTAAKETTFSFRLDEKVAETVHMKAGESQAIHVQREIELTLSDRSALQLTYNGKPMVVTSNALKLFNRNLFMKR